LYTHRAHIEGTKLRAHNTHGTRHTVSGLQHLSCLEERVSSVAPYLSLTTNIYMEKVAPHTAYEVQPTKLRSQ
jgi:hypothetical protein